MIVIGFLDFFSIIECFIVMDGVHIVITPQYEDCSAGPAIGVIEYFTAYFKIQGDRIGALLK